MSLIMNCEKDQHKCRKSPIVCIYSCKLNEKIHCTEYAKNYNLLQEEPISDYYLEKYGQPEFPLPSSVQQKQKELSKKEKEKIKADKEFEKLQRQKAREAKRLEKNNLRNEKKKLREEKKRGKLLQSGKSPSNQENKKRRGRPPKISIPSDLF